jgi:4-hydroxy-tetrahydrodipicolinate synthase
MVFKPKGVMPALVTPFTDDGNKIDKIRIKNLIDSVIDGGVSALVPCGTTGEFQNLSINERKKTIEIVIDHTNGRVPVIAATGHSSTKTTIELTQHAKDAGAEAALVVTPYYHKPTDRGIYEHYRTLAEAVDLPIILYNIPQATGVNLSWQMVEDLVEIPNIIGLKDSSGELRYMLSVLEKTGTKFSVLCGHDEVVLPALAAGASGMILASANIIPDIWVELYKSINKADLEKARNTQLRIQKITRIIAKSGPVGAKAALNMLGIKVGPVRLPLSIGGELTYEEFEELRIDLEKIGKLEKKIIKPFKVKTKRSTAEKLSPTGLDDQIIKTLKLKIGESLAGSGSEVAHVEIMIGLREGPLGEAFAKARSNPSPGHEPLLAILEPNLAVKPVTMIIPTVTIKNMRQASIVYGPAQSAAAKAVIDSVKDRTLPEKHVDDLMIIANVFVHPSAVDRKRVYINNYKATRHAIRRAIEGRPKIDELLKYSEMSKHPFRYTP